MHKEAQESFEKKYHGRVTSSGTPITESSTSDCGTSRSTAPEELERRPSCMIGRPSIPRAQAQAATQATPLLFYPPRPSPIKSSRLSDAYSRFKGEVASAAETVKAAVTTVKYAAEEAVHTVETLTGLVRSPRSWGRRRTRRKANKASSSCTSAQHEISDKYTIGSYSRDPQPGLLRAGHWTNTSKCSSKGTLQTLFEDRRTACTQVTMECLRFTQVDGSR